jgi:tripartite-type tricarboxylate transporter receptor subunit TctC
MHRHPVVGFARARRLLFQFGLAAVLAFVGAVAQAQGFPNRPVTLIVPFPAGGPTDVQLRAIAAATSKELGQPVVISNVPGVGGTLGPANMARTAAPNGYTLSVVVGSMFRMPHLQKVDYHPVNDFSYIIGLTGYTYGVAVSVDSPWKSMAELMADAKKNPGVISVGFAGRATIGHIMIEKLARTAGVQFNLVPYKGASDMMQAMLGRHLDVWADGGFGPGLDSGKLRLLATAGDNRAGRWPSAPTLKELGYEVVVSSPFGIAGPKGMDKQVVQVLHDAFRKSMADPAFIKALDASSQPVVYMSSAEYSAFAAEAFERERRFVQELNLKLE